MSRTQRHQQEALWEFVHTELAYINKLIVIKDVRRLLLTLLSSACERDFPQDVKLLFVSLCFWQLVIAALVNLHRNGFLLEVSQ